MTNAVNGKGDHYYKVRFGKKFTGSDPVIRNFRDLAEARAWIFGRDNNQADCSKPSGTGIVELKRIAGASAFAFTSAQLAEAAWALNALNGSSLTEAVKFYIVRTRPAGGVKRLSELIEEHINALAACDLHPEGHDSLVTPGSDAATVTRIPPQAG